MKKIWNEIRFLMGKNKLIGGYKTMNDIKAWLEQHGITMATAAQIMGFLKAYGIELPQINMCGYGLPYSFTDFTKWFFEKADDRMPEENTICVMWDKNAEAIISVLAKTDKMIDGSFRFIDHRGVAFSRCMELETIGQYRYVLNVPDDMPLDLPGIAWEATMKADMERIKAEAEKKPKRKGKNKNATANSLKSEQPQNESK